MGVHATLQPGAGAGDARRCPRCGQANACSQAEGAAPDAPCWCRAAPVSGLPLRHSDATPAVACLCAACLGAPLPCPAQAATP